MKVKTSRYERILYIVTALLLVLTLENIIKDKEQIRAYYQEKQESFITNKEHDKTLSDYFEGEGTEKVPYIIADDQDLINISVVLEKGLNLNGKYFIQTADIDLADYKDWKPIAFEQNVFNATYDGSGHTISNINLTLDNTSLFGNVGGIIKNLGITRVNYSASNCAAFINYIPVGMKANIINCFVTGSKNDLYEDNALFATEFSRGSLISCWSNDAIYMINATSEEAASIYNCTSTSVLYNGNNALLINTENNQIFSTFDQKTVSVINDKLETLNQYGIVGTFQLVEIDQQNKISFSKDNIRIINEEDKINFYKFFRNIFFYIVVFVIDIIVCILIAKLKNWNLAKCIFYSLMLITTLLTFGYGLKTRGTSLISLLYDGKTDGRLKVFTDFFDCVRPGFTPYTDVENGMSTIYPPLITLIFAILGQMIPKEELYSSIVAKDSQMGSLLFALCIAIVSIFIYKTFEKYKKGNTAEVCIFSILIGLSYPMLHCIERGNVTVLCAIFIIIFLYNYRSENVRYRHIAFISLSIAAGIKIYPAILGILLIKEKRIKDTANCLAYGVIINLLPSIFFNTGLSSIAYMIINAKTMVMTNSIIGGKVDLSHLIRIPEEIFDLVKLFNPADYYEEIRIVAILIGIIVILFGKLVDWKIYSIIILEIIILETFSPFYYILYMLAPLMMFLDSKRKSKSENIVYSILFVGIFMTFATIHKYPFAFLAPSQAIWNMTIISGGMCCLFLIVLLIDGLKNCFFRLERKGYESK